MDRENRAAQPVIRRQEVPQAVRQRWHPLAHRHRRHDLVHKVRGALGHPPSSAGTAVTVPRTFVEFVVTEYGIANLQGLTQRQRALALTDLAPPAFRATCAARRGACSGREGRVISNQWSAVVSDY
jgi:Acetyl-CoA hydrolase/transferase C-terminal domain